MLTQITNALATNVALGWIARRIPDWGGWLATFFGALTGFYLSMSPNNQEVVMMILSGNWGNITFGAGFGLLAVVFSQWRSWRATVKPQIVDAKGKRVEVPTLNDAQALALNNAVTGHDQTHIPTR